MTTLSEDIAAVEHGTQDLLSTAGRLGDADLGAPSLCEGWTRGHVLTHISRNADAIGRLVEWAVTGEPVEMYPGGSHARDAEIDAGAGRPAAAQLQDLRSSAAALAAQLPRLEQGTAVAEVQGRGGFVIASEYLPFMRLRELVLHHVDLDAGYTLADVDPGVLRRLIDDAVGRLRLSRRAPSLTVRTDAGDAWTVGDGAVTVSGPAATVLLWLARRRDEGLESDGPIPELPRGA